MSFYSIVALKKYSFLKSSNLISKNLISPQVHKHNISNTSKSSLRRLNLWLRLDHSLFARDEIDYILKAPNDRFFKDIRFKNSNMGMQVKIAELISFFNSKKEFLQSFKLLHRKINSNALSLTQKTLHSLFPFPYVKKIKNLGGDGLDPHLVLSLIRQESAFNPKARSHAGALGLMQLMPATARQMKKGISSQLLVDPETNLKLGIKHFKKLLKKYDGDLIFSLAAYNAGEGNLKKWKKKIFKADNDPLVLIESIPFKETRNYVKLIYRNIFFYKYLSGESEFLAMPFERSIKTTYTLNRK